MSAIPCPECGGHNSDNIGACPQCGPSQTRATAGPADLQPQSNGVAAVALTPELLEWARHSINEEETLAGMREIRENGGWALADFIHEVEQEAMCRD